MAIAPITSADMGKPAFTAAETGKPAYAAQTVSRTQDAVGVSGDQAKKSGPAAAADKNSVRLEDVQHRVDAMNQFFAENDTNIQFKIHQKSNKLMVQVVDDANRVIKEFPSHEYLDMVAAIRDYVGILLDKKI